MPMVFFFLRHSFVASERKTQVLPHMPPDRRKFVHDVRSPLHLLYGVADAD